MVKSIFLIGYMGSGKSTVGKLLAETIDFSFIDFDSFLEEKEGMTISQIFNLKGEVYFRKQEHFYLNEVVNLEQTVVAFGGGTPCYGNNMQDMLAASNSVIFYLKTSVELLTARLKDQLSTRPLIQHLKTEADLNDFIRKHLFERNFYYHQADYKIEVDSKSPQQIATEIIEVLN